MKAQFNSLFKFGVADADLQVIGEHNTQKIEGSEPTMWHYYATTSGKCYKTHSPAEGINRYHLWKNDIEIMKKIGIHHYRTSISMSRTIKKDGQVNKNAIEWYTQYFKELKKAGIKIYATLYHWELPQYINEKGGWKNRDTTLQLVKHAKIVAENLGEYIEEYFILNEPWCSSILSYYFGFHAPGETKLKNALLASHNLLLAQGLVYKTLNKIDKTLKISTAFNTEPAYAFSLSSEDILAAKYADGYFNRWFMDPLFIGKYPEDMLDLYGENVPQFSKEDLQIIKIGDKLHSFGINYYKGNLVKYNPKNDLKFEPVEKKGSMKNDLGWPLYLPPIYSEGLYDALSQIYYSYKDFGLKRLYLTENGIAQKTLWNRKDNLIIDEKRIYYLKEHIHQIYKAITKGIPIEAYFAWTLMDNYEWAEGYRPESCFGLIHVDRKTLKRVWKKSAYWYKNLIATRTLTE